MVDLRQYAGEIEIAGPGPCVANALVAAFELILEQKGITADLSRSYLYHETREFEGSIPTFQGIWFAGNALHVAATQGVPDESMWDYSPEHVYLDVDPSAEAHAQAAWQRVTDYQQLMTPADYAERQPHYGTVTPLASQIKAALDQGDPVVLSLHAGWAMLTLSGGRDDQVYPELGMPGNEFWGTHTVTAVGYDGDYLILENSRGPEWGDGGFWWFPVERLTDVYEAWVIRDFVIEGARVTEFDRDTLNVSVTLTEPTDIYAGAVWQGQVYINDGAWRVYNGLSPIAHGTEVVIELAGMDISPYAGAEVYVGWGSPEALQVVAVVTIPEGL